MTNKKQMVKVVEVRGNAKEEKVISEKGMVNLKEDIFTTGVGTAGSLLIPATIYNTLQSAVRRSLIFRQMAALMVGPSGIPGSSLNINLQTPESMTVFEVAEGAEIPYDKETYANRPTVPKKYGITLGITKEMVEDSQFDLMRFNAETAGYSLAKNEDELVVAQLNAASTAAGNDVSNANASLPITDITEAMQNLEEDNYIPSDMTVGVEVANDIRNIDTFTEADKSGVNNPSQRMIGTIFGMKVWVSNSVSAKLAYVIDRRKAFAVVEKRPVTLSNWDDFYRDTKFIAATQRVSVVYLYAEAVSEITTT